MDIYATAVLNGFVQSLLPQNTWLLDRYFAREQRSAVEEIHFDIEKNNRRIAPFVSPLVAGKIVESKGFNTAVFRPAYVKDKRVFDVNRPLKRAIGEQIGGTMSPMARLQSAITYELQDQVTMLGRRLEVMAGETLALGQVTVVGDQYPSTVVNYTRDSTLTVALTGGNRWGQTGVKPLDSLQDWSQIVLKLVGAMPRDVIMTVDAWKLFRNDADVKVRLDRFRGTSTVQPDAQIEEGGAFMGGIDGFNIFVYSGWYTNDSGVETVILPANTVLLVSPQIEGYRAFGAIRDEEAGYQAVPNFSKSWIDHDPAVRYLLMQSAPLTVPYRPNAMLAATVN